MCACICCCRSQKVSSVCVFSNSTCPVSWVSVIAVSNSGPLLLYQPQPRLQIGLTLMKNENLGDLGPYIPTFYQKCSSIKLKENSLRKRMQQPLAHLYFLTVLEHLSVEEQNLANNSMVRAAKLISQQCKLGISPAHFQILLHIELQAVIQVLAKLLALHLDSSEQSQMVEIQPLINEINELFDDVSTGGGDAGGHGLVLALHMLRKLRSSRKFSELLSHKFEVVCKEIKCLQPLHERLKVCKYV